MIKNELLIFITFTFKIINFLKYFKIVEDNSPKF